MKKTIERQRASTRYLSGSHVVLTINKTTMGTWRLIPSRDSWDTRDSTEYSTREEAEATVTLEGYEAA